MSVANAYAKALYEAAADAKATQDTFKQIESQLEDFGKLVDSSRELKVVLEGPVITSNEKAAVVEALVKKTSLNELVSRFLILLAQKNRFALLPQVREAFRAVKLKAEGGVAGALVTADPMSDSDVEGLAKAFSKKLGKPVAFRVSTDPSLLAGIKVTVNGVTYDGTLRSQLQRLRDQFVHGTGATH